MCVVVCILAYTFRKKQWKVNPKTNEDIHFQGQVGHREAEAGVQLSFLILMHILIFYFGFETMQCLI